MRVLQAVLGHLGCRLYTVGYEVLAEVEEALGHLCRPLCAGGVPVARPGQLGQRRGTRPHLHGDDSVVDLFGPERGGDANDVLGLAAGEVGGEVVVVDALPGLVWGAPRATVAAIVEGDLDASRVRVFHHIVAWIIGHPTAEAAV